MVVNTDDLPGHDLLSNLSEFTIRTSVKLDKSNAGKKKTIISHSDT